MKIIDNQGKVFGKINIIDLIVILFVFMLFPMGYVGYKISRVKGDATKDFPPPIIVNYEEKYNELILQLNCFLREHRKEIKHFKKIYKSPKIEDCCWEYAHY